jgi:hypothetical protein
MIVVFIAKGSVVTVAVKPDTTFPFLLIGIVAFTDLCQNIKSN